MFRKNLDRIAPSVNYFFMMMFESISDFGDAFVTEFSSDNTSTLVVCEHASNRIPDSLNNLQLPSEVLESHVAWDPGALAVAQALARQLSGPLVSGNISRLVYDCNRPPEAASAIPAKSEIYDIEGNRDLSEAEREARVQRVYHPFHRAVAEQIQKHSDTLKLLVTVHSFTPVYYGEKRAVELGILHGQDDRFAKAMMADQSQPSKFVICLNEPYSSNDGVAHTLDLQGAENGLLNVMLEIRNDLIQSVEQQNDMASYLAPWIKKTLENLSGNEATE